MGSDLVRGLVFDSDLGWWAVGVTSRGVRRVILPRPSPEAAWDDLTVWLPEAVLVEADTALDVVDQLRRYAAGERVTFDDVPLDLAGATTFRLAVWNATRQIPYGEVRTYKWIAHEVGRPRGPRAVGQALGANPIPVIIPCHRVIGSDGGLTGFGDGVETKARLLALEGVMLR